MRTPCGIAFLALLAGCAQHAPSDPRLLQVAKDYGAYGRVSDHLRWAPTLCSAPPPDWAPAPPRMSVSRDAETHGRKLYYLYAKDFDAYRMSDVREQPVGQVLVKEGWMPAESSTPKRPVAGQRAPLFMMMKTGEPDSDAGWIYATLTPDGRVVTAAGKIASCIECHETKKDRLFGVKSCASAAE
jgi:hypothetical protein